MKMRFLGISLVLLAFLASGSMSFAAPKNPAPSSFVYQAINKYKQKNYTGCIQDMEYVIKNGKPTDIVYYYQAISYAKLGMVEEARQAYNSAYSISSNIILKDYADQALQCIDNAESCDIRANSQDISSFIKSEKFMHNDVKNDLQDNAARRIQNEINSDTKPSKMNTKYLNMNDAPTDKEIADAVRTFSKLGINPYAAAASLPVNMYSNPEMMQINAMLNNNNNNSNNMMNLVPMLTSMSQNGSNVSKEFMQTYMMSQMMPNLSFGNNDK